MTDLCHKIYSFKVALLGNSGVGKSSLTLRFAKQEFTEQQVPTIGASYLSKTMALDDNIHVKFNIWDTAGQERYDALSVMYYRGASAAMIVYDITDESSFCRAKRWIRQLVHEIPVIMLVCNKVDLIVSDSKRANMEDEKRYAHDNGVLFMDVSAKSNHNVTEAFRLIANKLPKVDQVREKSVIIDQDQFGDTEPNKCCS
jgi:Ras-related protein Rab-5C